MSVASVAQLLEDQGGGGGGGSVFDTITIGPSVGIEVILSCDTADQLLIAGETAATRPYVIDNYIDNTDYYTTTEFETYLTTNYTDNTALAAGYVSNATLQADYYTTTEFQTYLTTNYTDTTALNAGYVANATLINYYTKTEANNAFQPIGDYILSSTFGRFNGLVDISPLGVDETETIPITITGFVGSANTAYLCGISSNFTTPFIIVGEFVSTDNTDTIINVSFTNASSLNLANPITVLLSVIAMN